MYYIKYVVMKPLYCPKCGKDVLHECGYLFHKMEEDSPLIRLFSVHECVGCGIVYDARWHPVELDYTLI